MDGTASTTTALAPPAGAPVGVNARGTESAAPPPHLPADPGAFYRASGSLESISLVAPPESQHVLELLGPPPFRKSSFPLMGFLASLYEHIAAQVARRPG
jgi:hypothetical protein